MRTSAKAVLFSLFLSRSRCLFSFPSSLSLPLIDKDKANLFGNQGHGWCRQTLLLRSPPRPPSPLPPSPFFLHPQRFVFFDSIAKSAAPERSGVRCRRSGSAEPHSCHTPAPLQCISSSRGHASASAVITAGVSDHHFQRRNVFFMQIMKGRKPRSENNEGPNLEERKRIPVWLTEHLLRAGEMGEVGGWGSPML